MLAKRPGDRWRQFANQRALFAYMWARCGKKLIFMGEELGQWREWDHDTSLDWNLLDYPDHRELQVLGLLAAGKSNQRIAHDLVALDTVKKHVTHILGKLGAANRTEAAARARQLGLIP